MNRFYVFAITLAIRLAITLILSVTSPSFADLTDAVEKGHADSDGVKIHYASVGEGPLVVMIHGFPDYWYSWRHQMEALKSGYKVVAIDQRGYNHSDQPKGVEHYAMPNLVKDVAAVIRHHGADKATIVGHDWGGAVAWQFAFAFPEMTERLVVMNLPHPRGMAREFAINKEQQNNSDYARRFRTGSAADPDIFFGGPMTAHTISGWVSDPEARKHYVEAFKRSDFDGMLNYYKANYGGVSSTEPPKTPMLKMPVLVFHGLKDTALHSDGLNNTWDWVDADLTIVTTPEADHFVQQDAAELVSSTLRWWLDARR